MAVDEGQENYRSQPGGCHRQISPPLRNAWVESAGLKGSDDYEIRFEAADDFRYLLERTWPLHHDPWRRDHRQI